MEIKEINQKEILNQFASSLLLRWEWGEFKKNYGWEAKRLAFWKNNKIIYAIQILIKNLPLDFSLIYVPIVLPPKKIIKKFLEEIKKIAKKEKAIFLQLDILDKMEPQKDNEIKELGFRKSFKEIQPKNSLILDLTLSENEILKQMKPKGRYNIKLAQKKGIVIKEIKNLNEFSDYKRIHQDTIKRNKFAGRSFNYLKDLFSLLHNNNLGTCFIAYYQNKPIAGIIISLIKDEATYMYGASLYEYRNLMAPYLLQWEAIKYAKNKGAKTYDFFGITPSKDTNHPWYGITRFKKQFGGKEIEILGSYDLIFKPFLYKIFKIAYKLRKIYA